MSTVGTPCSPSGRMSPTLHRHPQQQHRSFYRVTLQQGEHHTELMFLPWAHCMFLVQEEWYSVQAYQGFVFIEMIKSVSVQLLNKSNKKLPL